MRNWILAAGVAALALTGPAAAHNHRGDKAKGPPAAKAERANDDRGAGKANRGEAGEPRQIKSERTERKAEASPPGRGRDGSPGIAKIKVDRPASDAAVSPLDVRESIRVVRRDFGEDFFRRGRVPFDCPPGLDRKDNGCFPPGQALKLVGAPLRASFADAVLPFQYRNWYPDTDDYFFRAGDGFIYRVNRSNNLVDGLIPLFGNGYYTLGDPWPQPYDFYNVPNQYRSYWMDGDDYRYRYSDGAIYRLDPTTNAVNAIVALLAGDLGVGSRLPVGYDAYNVPLAFRSQYADTSDAWYRYNDGYIYRVDPTTRLITAVIDAIV